MICPNVIMKVVCLSFYLHVSTAEIVIAPADTDVEVGNTAIFTCVAVSTPAPVMSWGRNGVLLSNESNPRTSVYFDTINQSGLMFTVATLELCGVAVNDSGEYTCTASEGGVNTSVYFSLYVTGEGKLFIELSLACTVKPCSIRTPPNSGYIHNSSVSNPVYT